MEQSTRDLPVTEFNVILDFDEYPLAQVTHIESKFKSEKNHSVHLLSYLDKVDLMG